MLKECITQKQACSIAILYVMTNSFSTLYGVNAGRDVWISYALAQAASALVWILLHYACKRNPSLGFFKLCEKGFGRILGSVFIFLLAVYAFLSMATSVSEFGRFTQLTALSKTPLIIIPMLIILLAVYVLKSGIEVLARCASLAIPFAAFVVLYFFSFGSDSVKPETLSPLLENGFNPVIRQALNIFVNQFGRTLLLAVLIKNIKPGKSSSRCTGLILGVVIGSTAVTLIALSTVATLGQAQTASEFYPIFTVLSIRNVGGFIQHMEILTCIAGTVFLFFRAALGLYFTVCALSHLFKESDYKIFSLPVALLAVSATQLLHWNAMSLRRASEGDMAIVLITPLLMVLPVLLCAILHFKRPGLSPNGR